ncbi:hypothetical protein [Mycobacterium kyorinense]|nr:hypothetical protein [Mycobacterium kyorinense]
MTETGRRAGTSRSRGANDRKGEPRAMSRKSTTTTRCKTAAKILTLRAAFLLMSALVCGACAAALIYLGSRDAGRAVISGVAVFAGAVVWFDKVVDDE